MSRIFEALQQANPELGRTLSETPESAEALPSFTAALIGESGGLEEVPQFSLPADLESRLVAWLDPNSLAAENLRALSARLRHAQRRKPVKTILVTSAVRGDGKSTISSNLAITLAAHGERTLLLDGDLHQSSLASTLRVDGEPGFADWCERSEPVANLLCKAEGLPLWFLPAGVCVDQPLTVLQSPRASELLKLLAGWFSWVIIDSPPLLPVIDGKVWATMSDTVLFVARQGVTPRKALTKCLESFDKSKLFALVMNDSTPQEERYYRDYRKASGSIEARRRAARRD